MTGLSGAGISTTMKILEDVGYVAFDNFPFSLIPDLLRQDQVAGRPIAVTIDTRAPGFDPVSLMEKIEKLKDDYTEVQIKTLFLVADDAVLLKRYTETRRIHPMARDRSVRDGIMAEKALLFPLKHAAGYVIDTSDYSIHDLRRVVESYAGGLMHRRMNVTVMSFSYKHGLPREADLVLDVRFLQNPNWEKDLKDKTGLDAEVQDFVRADGSYTGFVTCIRTMLDILLPQYRGEGKSYLTIAFGCTGGRHRSVTLAEEIGAYIKDKNIPVHIHHREIKAKNL